MAVFNSQKICNIPDCGEIIKKECEAIEGKYNGKQAISAGGKEYTVKGWGIDSNGCIITYDEKYSQSFVVDTEYI